MIKEYIKNKYSELKKNRNKAFSLFEILIAIAMVSVLSYVTVANLTTTSGRMSADKQMIEVKDVFLATDSIVDEFWSIDEARSSLFPDGRPTDLLVADLGDQTTVKKSKLKDYTFSIDEENRLIVKYKDYLYNGSSKYMPDGGKVAVTKPEDSDIEIPVVDEEDYTPTDSDWIGEKDGEFQYVGSKTTVVIPHEIKGVKVTSYKSMFDTEQGRNVNTVISNNSNITDMSYMFKGSKASNIDLSKFETRYVTSMAYMFAGSKSPSLDLSSFNTARVVDMEGMFYESEVIDLDVRSFNTSKVVNMSYMFYRDEGFNPSNVNHLNLGFFDTSNVFNMRNMFKNSPEILGYARTKTDADKLNNSHNKPSTLKFIVLANENDFLWVRDNNIGYERQAENGKGYYQYKGGFNEVAMPEKIKGETLTNYTRMFANTSVDKLVSISPNITSMKEVFAGSRASHIDTKRINTKNTTDMSGMFYNANTTSIDFNGFNTRNVVDMSEMFYNSKMMSVDLKMFKTSNVTNMERMFVNFRGPELKLTSFDMVRVAKTTDMFKGAKATRGYARSQADADTLNASSNRPYELHFVIMATDEDFRWYPDSTNGYSMAGRPNVGYWRYEGPAIEIELPNKIYGVTVKNYNRMFNNSPVIKVISPNPNITDMSGMFYESNAPKLDLRGVNTSNVTRMKNMFYGANAKDYTLRDFDTSKVQTMSGMFSHTAATSIDFSSLDTRNVTDMSRMFYNSSLPEIDVSGFKLNNVTNTSEMFRGYPGKLLKLDSFNMDTVTNTNNMFLDTAARTGYARSQSDATKLNNSTNKPHDLVFVVMATDADFSGERDGEFKYIGSAVEVGIPHVIKGVNVTSYNEMFQGTGVKKIESTNKNITNMRNMFAQSTSDTLDLSTLYSKNVNNMEGMFDGSKVKNLDIRNLDTSNVTNMSRFFKDSIIPTIDFSKLDTSSLTNAKDMFKNAKATRINIDNMVTKNVTTMESMFENTFVNELEVDNFNTISLVNANKMFKNANATSFDVSGFNTSKLAEAQETFYNTKTQEIDISGWDTSKLKNANGMFKNTKSVITGFEGMDTSSLENANNILYGVKNITSLDLRAWNVSKLKYASASFAVMPQLKSINVRGWNTANLRSISYMFADSGITEFDLSDWNTSSLTGLNDAFRGNPAKVGFARTQADADKLNTSSGKSPDLIFGVKSNIKFIDRGETIFSKVIATGNTIPTPSNPTRTGYTFRGWHTVNGPTGGTKFNPGDKVTGDVTYYARWTINSYTITFDGNTADSVSTTSITKNYNSAIGTLPTATKTGYDFLGWYTAKSGGSKITSSTRIIEDRTYYAQWKVQPRTFTFDRNGGGVPSVDKITKGYGSTVGTLPTVSRSGYIFNGWFTSKTGGTKLTTGTRMYNDTRYYAQWTLNDRVFTFDANGGTNLSTSRIVKSYNSEVGTLPTVSRTGYSFEGWYTATSGGSKLYTDTRMTSDTTYYARWKIIENTLKLNPNGGTIQGTTGIKSITKDYGDMTFVTNPTRTGHNFNGWSQSGSGELKGYGQHVPSRSDATASNQDYWMGSVGVYNNRRNDKTTLTRMTLSGTNPFNPSWSNRVIRVKSSGYDQSPGRGGIVNSTMSSANRTYYHVIVATIPKGVSLNNHNNAVGNGAKFTWLTSKEGTGKPETYIYKLDSGSGGSFSTFGHVAAYGGPSNLEWDIHFAHMFDATGSKGYISNSELVSFDNKGNKTLTANWAKNPYTVKFNGNGGSNQSNRTIYYGDQVGGLPSSSRTGYTFKGWYTSTSGGSKISSGTRIYGNTTYYAQWSKNSYYTYFNGNGGSNASSKLIPYGNAVGSLPSSSRTGYTFKGWYTATSGGSKISTGTKPWGTKTYYAQWTRQNRKFNFNSNGGGSPSKSSITKPYNSTVGTLPTVSRTGYTFKGWYTATSGGSKLSTGTRMTSDTTYYARWEIKSYKVTINPNYGSSATQTRWVKYNYKLGDLPGYGYHGNYKHMGFASSSGAKGPNVDKNTRITYNRTIYGHWLRYKGAWTWTAGGRFYIKNSLTGENTSTYYAAGLTVWSVNNVYYHGGTVYARYTSSAGNYRYVPIQTVAGTWYGNWS